MGSAGGRDPVGTLRAGPPHTCRRCRSRAAGGASCVVGLTDAPHGKRKGDRHRLAGIGRSTRKEDPVSVPLTVSNPSWLGDVRVSVVIPALNEAENLPHVLPRIPPWVHEVILVDDHCTDETVAVARELLPTVRVTPNLRAPGKGNALRAGFEAVTGDIIVQVDADGSEAPEEIPNFVGALLSGADYAKGTRFVTGGGT